MSVSVRNIVKHPPWVLLVCIALAAFCVGLVVYLDGIPNWRVLLGVVVILYWLFRFYNLEDRVRRLERRGR